jgi:hypothetical protein
MKTLLSLLAALFLSFPLAASQGGSVGYGGSDGPSRAFWTLTHQRVVIYRGELYSWYYLRYLRSTPIDVHWPPPGQTGPPKGDR